MIHYLLVDVNCDANTFKCSIGDLQCIPWLWVCDGDEDCNAGEDESQELCGLCHTKIYDDV